MTFIGIEYHVQNRIKKQRTEEGNFIRGLVSDAWETLMFQIYFYNTCLWRFRNIDVSNLFSSTSFFQTNFFNLFLTRQKCFKFTFLKPFLMRQKYFKFTFFKPFLKRQICFKLNVSLVHVWKSIKKRFSFAILPDACLHLVWKKST